MLHYYIDPGRLLSSCVCLGLITMGICRLEEATLRVELIPGAQHNGGGGGAAGATVSSSRD